jgi:3',5'-cyclic AMP phosphodiesterase CpdA
MNCIRLLLFSLVIGICFAQEQNPKTILFVSDTQEPLWIETLRLNENDNPHATQKLFSAMARESSAVALFHLGDITAIGTLDGYWRSFDTLRRLIRFPIYPAFGNHEYFFISSLGKEQVLKRFPFLEPSWYTTRIGTIAVILLNSNFSKLSDGEILAQQQWYADQLLQLENDSTVNAIIVGCHHSPFTNSSIVNADKEVQRQFVEPFKHSAKAKLFISGHAHLYEHFQSDGKDFLVIGGGGGLLQPLNEVKQREWNDISPEKANRKFFHYVSCEIGEKELKLTAKMLMKDLSGFDVVDTIGIPYK